MRINIPELFTRVLIPDVSYAFLRAAYGTLLVMHGAAKLQNGLGGFAQSIAKRGWPFPEVQAMMATYTEFAGGVFLIVGLFSRAAALVNVVLFTIITFGWSDGAPFFEQKEKPFVFLVIAIYLFFVGPGKLSVDRYLFRKPVN